MRILLKRKFLWLLGFVFLFSCSEYQKVINSENLDLKLEWANRFYEEEDYLRAYPLFDELRSVYRGAFEAQQILYRLANCEYNTHNLEIASYHFKQYFETYSYNPKSEEALFMHAKCLYESSPKYSLDQLSSKKAFNAFQLFALRFPKSEWMEECNRILDELREREEQKAFENAKIWYKIMDYKSAQWSLTEFCNSYPSSKLREEAEFMRIDATFNLSKNSIEIKQAERFNSAISFSKDFILRYPSSPYLTRVRQILEQSKTEIQKISQ